MERELFVIVYCLVAKLRLDPGNPRTHPKKQIRQIAASIAEFGFVNPVLIDELGAVIAGHGRVLAAILLGLKSVPTITLSGLSPAQKRALRLADNRIAENSGWDPELIRIELQALIEVNYNVEVTGYSSGEIDIHLNPGPDAGLDDVVEPPAKPCTRLGDIYVLDKHRIGCGDAQDKAFVQEVMGPDVRADAAFLDAPFNVSIGTHANKSSDHKEFAMASGEMSPEEFTAFLIACFMVALKLSRDGAVHFICADWRHIAEFQAAARDIYWVLLNLCVWNKSNAGMGSLYRSKHELIFVYRAGSGPHFNAIELGRHGRHRSNVWDYPSVTSPKGSRRTDLELHPTTKPVALVADAICDVTRRGDVVLDLFLGSGTTLIACERTGRVCRGVEIDPAYVDAIVERWKTITGHEPKLIRKRRK
jgi:DNA modification methylase